MGGLESKTPLMSQKVLFLGLVAVAFVAADIKFSRTVSSVHAGFSGSVSLDSGCTGKDAYGSNNCDLKWGGSNSVTVTGTLPEDLNSGSKVAVSVKVDHIFPWDFTCSLCGAPCTITVPVVKKKVTIKLPPCPIKKGSLNQSKKFTLPSKCPTPVGISASGSATVTDDSGSTIAKISVNADVGPPSDAVTPVMDYQTGVAQLPDMIVDMMTGLLGANVTAVEAVPEEPFWASFIP